MASAKKNPRPLPRITGLETEYGCMVASAAAGAVARVRDWVFDHNRFGLIDRHDRDWDEPPGNGGFLFNGGRVYLDMGHFEYCTPECASVTDVLRYDRAGDRLLLAAVKDLGLAESVHFFRNNIDHRSGATFGCHENFSLLRRAPLTEANVLSLLAFLTLRVLFTGSGRVGSARPTANSTEPAVEFQVSQRADYIENDFYEWVQHNRAIINTRDEPLADRNKYRRLHLIHGDTHVLPSALFLKIGATRLVLDLMEADSLPQLHLADAVGTLRSLSHQPAPPWTVRLGSGEMADPVEVLSRFRQRAQQLFSGRDAETDAVLDLWLKVERGLASDLSSLVGLVDWVTKQHLLEAFRQSEKLEWDDPWLEAQDLEYHHIDPERSLGLALANLEGPWAVGWDDAETLVRGPRQTRANRRSELMRKLAEGGHDYKIDWDQVESAAGETVLMPDPLGA
ncbi:MAG: proteasome accessory factor [Verrucomicrobia bacterium]|nr:proteasome accessory factor [Verrucomicrobiota bacterium]